MTPDDYRQENDFGGLRVAKILKIHGVKFVFTLTGGHIAPILVGCKKEGIRVIDVRHEVTTVFAADGVSRLTGVPGVAIVTAGPGVTNTVTAVKNAQMAQSPVILIGGSTPTLLKGRGALQDIDQMALLKPHLKWATTVKTYSELPKVEQAFKVAKEGVPGPVFVEMPIDLLWPEFQVKDTYKTSFEKLKKSLSGKVTAWYINRYLKNLFKGREVLSPPKVLSLKSRSISRQQVQKVISVLNRSERPVLLISSQVLLDVDLVEEVVLAINSLGIPTYLSGMARGLLGKDNPLQLRHRRRNALREADTVILAGVPIDFRLDYGRIINRRATLISVNRSKVDLKKNRKPDIGILGCPGCFLIEIARNGSFQTGKWNPWLEKCRERDNERNNEISQQALEQMARINPLNLCKTLEQVLPENSCLIGDGGDFIATVSYIVQPRKPLSWLDPGPFGTLGAGAGFALAAKLCRPEDEVWLLYGDGSVGYTLAEWDTFVRHGIPVIGLIGNDSGWMQIARDQVKIFGDGVGTELGDRFYEKVVEGFGVEGILLKEESSIRETLERARKINKQGKPVLINALIDRTDFRDGSIAM
ncbi:MAG: thiamine pyrophosphate-binding protein [Candidatus Odinarchaeota archaeon]